MTQHHSRRDFMRLTCCSAAGAALVGGLSKFGLVSAMAQGATDYKALVCIFLFGGNDSNNMIVPIDSRYAAYQQARANIALPQGQLLPLQTGSQANLRVAPEHAGIAGLLQQSKESRRACQRGHARSANHQGTIPTRTRIFLRTCTRIPTSRISGRALNFPARRPPDGPARLPTAFKAPTTPARNFLRFYPSAATLFSVPETPRVPLP